MASTRSCYYAKEWEDVSKFPECAKWVVGTQGGTTFSCKYCKLRKPLELGNMGLRAVKSHGSSVTHIKHVEDHEKKKLSQSSVSSFFGSSSVVNLCQSSSSQVCPSQSAAKQTTIKCLSKESKTSTILLALQSVTSHISHRAMEEMVQLLPRIAPDSDIVQNIQLGRTKLGYIITYGLSVYYKNQLLRSLLPPLGAHPKFVSYFDEAMNRITKSKQMDLHVTYFDEKKQLVVRSYIGAHFMGRAKQEDTYRAIKEVHGDLDIVNNLIQVSMDGPNVNWATLRLIADGRVEANSETHTLLNMGSCGLHVLHGAFGTGQKASGWNIDKLCKFSYSIFKKAPARREDYLRVNELLESHLHKEVAYLFPQKFAGHRWLENGKALRRQLETNGYLKRFMKFCVDEKKMPKSDDRFTIVNSMVNEKFISPKLYFSLTVAGELEPFLAFFQAERPLSVFLFEELKSMLDIILERLVRADVLKEKSTAAEKMKIDLKEESNLTPVAKMNLGHSAEAILKKSTTLDAPEVRKLRQAAREFLVALVEKIKERSPLKYKLTKYISSLSPTQIANSRSNCLHALFNKLCAHFVECKLIPGELADKAERSYKEFIKSNTVKERMANFDMRVDRLDEFYVPQLKSHPELLLVVKLVLILAHGNARVESGFSINDDLLIENMKEESMVANRLVYEGVMKEGGVAAVQIGKEMMEEVDKAHKRYAANLELQREQQTCFEKRKQEKRKLTAEMNAAKAAKVLVTEELRAKTTQLDSEIFRLEQELKK